MIRSIGARILVVTLALSLASLACNLGLSAPTPPASPIPVSTEAAGQLEDSVDEALANAQDGEVTLEMTEEQVTSYVAVKLQDQPDVPFSEPQVFLRNGQVIIYGTADLEALSTPAQITLEPHVTAEGGLKLAIVNADFGLVPVPASVLSDLETNLNELMASKFSPEATGMQIKSVAIADGTMTLHGEKTR